MAIKSDAQRKAVAKYNKKNYDQIQIRVPKGDKDRYKEYAESKGKSLTGLIVELLENDIQKDL